MIMLLPMLLLCKWVLEREDGWLFSVVCSSFSTPLSMQPEENALASLLVRCDWSALAVCCTKTNDEWERERARFMSERRRDLTEWMVEEESYCCYCPRLLLLVVAELRLPCGWQQKRIRRLFTLCLILVHFLGAVCGGFSWSSDCYKNSSMTCA